MSSTGYLGEFVTNRRAMTAACFGLIAGTISNYVGSLFAPKLIAAFGWSKSEFALIGLTVIISAISLPIVGRLADRYGMRQIALAGVVGLPLVFIGLAMQQGSFTTFFMLTLAQLLIISSLAGIIVYNRLIVRNFVRARGLALGVASCTPALTAAAGMPFLSQFIESHGWRAGYMAMAAFTALLGAAALALIPRDFHDRADPDQSSPTAAGEYGRLFRNRSFLILLGAMLLCNLHFTMQTSQLKLIVTDVGISSADGSALISFFAIGVIVGRITCGWALDRFEPRIVAALSFLIPAAGLAVLSSGIPSLSLLTFAVAGLGFSVGAEGDIAAYLVTRYFRPDLFSTVLGLVAGAMGVSALAGSLLLSRTIALSGGYGLFLAIASGSVLLGSLSFLLLRRDAEIVAE